MSPKVQVIAFYLPQFHPFKENNEWWGNGFTEWTNVGKAKRLFPGHYQPRVPADLGYYDLRLPEVREAQAELAREAGISAFCYWHYWFGNGRQLMTRPLEDVVASGKPDFPFCLGWANHSWERKFWNGTSHSIEKNMLLEQTYPDDIDLHFNTMLPVFKDRRYYRVHGKLLFLFHLVKDIPYSYLEKFISRWQTLAEENGLPGFFFVARGTCTEDLECPAFKLCDGVNLSFTKAVNPFKVVRFLKEKVATMLHIPLNIIPYEKSVKMMLDPIYKKNGVYPVILPNWDNSPRIGSGAMILHNSTPEKFKKHICDMLELTSEKPPEDRIFFLKSWNEWAEGNYMEPDLRYGKGYIRAMYDALQSGK